MTSLVKFGKSAGGLLAILSVIGIISAWVGGFMPSYALASDLDDHIIESNKRIIIEIDDKILIINDSLEVYDYIRAEGKLTSREVLRESQLTNRKQRYLRQLDAMI